MKLKAPLQVRIADSQNPPSNFLSIDETRDFGVSLGTSKVLDARRRGVTTEAYE